MYFSLTKNITPEEFRAALAPLESHGIPCSQWTVDSPSAYFIITRHFLKTIKIVTSVSDDSFRAVMIKAMIAGGFFEEAANATPESLYNGCNWLKTKPGQRIVRVEQLKSKLKMRAEGTEHSVEQMSQLFIFDQQRMELAVARKKQTDLNSNMELKSEFLPALDYVEMDKTELNAACYMLWKQETEAKDQLMSNVVEPEMYATCVDKFGKMAREKHALRFLAAEANRVSQLRAYLESKILHFHSVYDRKQLERFNDHLAVGFGGDIELPDNVTFCVTDPFQSSRAAKRQRAEDV